MNVLEILKKLPRRHRDWAPRIEQYTQEEAERAIRSIPRHYAVNMMQYEGSLGATSPNTDRGPSPIVWDGFGAATILQNFNYGAEWCDDFKSFGGTVTTKVGTYSGDQGGYKSYEETSGSIKQINTFLPTNPAPPVGAIELLSTAHAQDTIAIEAGYGNGGSWGLTGNILPKLYFEARLYVNMTTIAGCDIFIGLLEKGGAGAAFLFTTADAINQKSMLGFISVTGTPTVINPYFGKNGVAPVTLAGAGMTTGNGAGAWVSKTWTKLGFRYDPQDSNGRVLQYFQDGKLMSWVTDCTLSTFPTTKVLTPCLIIQNDNAAATASAIDLDWWRCGLQINK